jgi:predicted nucleotidyltransferase
MTAIANMDRETERAVRRFINRIRSEFDLDEAFLFGSRARGQYRPNSDADVAVLLHGRPGPRVDVALRMADIAFDVLLDTGIVIEAIPFWEEEWAHPEHFSNPALIANIRREGIRL